MPKKLRKLRILEGSLVTRGACPGAVIALWKSADGGSAAMRSLKAELLSIQREEPPEERLALYLEAIDDYEAGLRPERASTELDRMLSYARAGGQVHSWSDADVYEAMTSLALRLSPDLPAETALAKNFIDRDMAALYGLYKTAERAHVEPEPVEKVHEKTPAEIEIEAMARAVMVKNPSYTFAHAVSHIMTKKEGIKLYEAHRQQIAERYARRGGSVL